MGSGSSAVRRRPMADAKIRKEARGAAAPLSGSTASCASSSERTVLLHDWWLIKAKEGESSREMLAVGGMASSGKAVRIFNSAPIIKRYDAYTLETADGITVAIQGLINISRMDHNGFPPEACDHFRIGFPYSWKDYADKYFSTDPKGNNPPTCTSDSGNNSMDSANYASYDFPKHLKEFPVGRLIDSLNSICKEILEGDERSIGTLGNFGERNYNYDKTNGIVLQADPSIDANVTCAAGENVCTATLPTDDIPGLNSSVDESRTSTNDMADGPLFSGNIKIGCLSENNAGFETESLLTVITGQHCKNEGVASTTEGNKCCINNIPVSDLGSNSFFSESLPEDSGKSESEPPKKDLLVKRTDDTFFSSESSFRSCEFDLDATNSAGRLPQMNLVSSASSDVLHATKQIGNPEKKGRADSSSFLLSQNEASVNHDQVESGATNHFDRLSFTRACEVHPEISVATENFSHDVKDIVLQEGCHLNETIFSSVAPGVATSKEIPRKDVLIVDSGLHEKTSLNSDVDFRTETICYSKWKPENEHCSPRRSRRILESKSTVWDIKNSLKFNEKVDKNGSMSMVDRIQNEKSSTPTLSEGASSIGSGILPKRDDVSSPVAHKLDFSSLKSLHGRNATSIRCMLHIGSEGDKEQDAKSVQDSSNKSEATYGHGKENSMNIRKDNLSFSSIGTNQVVSLSDDHHFLSTENVIGDSHVLSRDRHESENANLSPHPMKQSISNIDVDRVVGNVNKSLQSDASVDIQQSDIKRSHRKAKVSIQKPYTTSQVETHIARERTSRSSFATPELLNFGRSRSGRLLVPALDNWCQKILYDMDGSIAGIVTGKDAMGSSSRGSKSKRSRKRRKQA